MTRVAPLLVAAGALALVAATLAPPRWRAKLTFAVGAALAAGAWWLSRVTA